MDALQYIRVSLNWDNCLEEENILKDLSGSIKVSSVDPSAESKHGMLQQNIFPSSERIHFRLFLGPGRPAGPVLCVCSGGTIVPGGAGQTKGKGRQIPGWGPNHARTLLPNQFFSDNIVTTRPGRSAAILSPGHHGQAGTATTLASPRATATIIG